ncbi:hypothetical protein JAAARDRAFT_28578 [Jaapia argillacea MUCL 33604]|uniref:Uncharacterized protein n=1 Tax=Jaapia argillacea MUCL 33604 TaxID=933084 RepID=A0A067QN23_9AGAM|nr:hypothetical protein JAAARDRAFT_28578 [Jaapia argillacea MUCL 33604]
MANQQTKSLPLQHILTAYESILQSFENLSHQHHVMSTALMLWGLGESTEFANCVAPFATILSGYSTTFSKLAQDLKPLSDIVKSIQASVDGPLEDLNRIKQTLASKVDASRAKDYHDSSDRNAELERLTKEMGDVSRDIIAMEATLAETKQLGICNWMEGQCSAFNGFSKSAMVIGERARVAIDRLSSGRQSKQGDSPPEIQSARETRRLSKISQHTHSASDLGVGSVSSSQPPRYVRWATAVFNRRKGRYLTVPGADLTEGGDGLSPGSSRLNTPTDLPQIPLSELGERNGVVLSGETPGHGPARDQLAPKHYEEYPVYHPPPNDSGLLQNAIDPRSSATARLRDDGTSRQEAALGSSRKKPDKQPGESSDPLLLANQSSKPAAMLSSTDTHIDGAGKEHRKRPRRKRKEKEKTYALYITSVPSQTWSTLPENQFHGY